MPLAPGRFSTTTCWPICLLSSLARLRELISGLPPGAEATIRRIGRFGYSAAITVVIANAAQITRNTLRRIYMWLPLASVANHNAKIMLLPSLPTHTRAHEHRELFVLCAWGSRLTELLQGN